MMTMRTGDGYKLPGASRAGIPQHLQLKKHETFTPEYIARRGTPSWTVGDGPSTPFVAEPPEWTEQALCLDDWERFDDPRAEVFHKVVAPICAACPVKDICLDTALEEEKGVPLSLRTGVRGGLRPKDRMRIGLPPVPDIECSLGHSYRALGAYLDMTHGNAHWRCAECQRSKKRARRAARKGLEAA